MKQNVGRFIRPFMEGDGDMLKTPLPIRKELLRVIPTTETKYGNAFGWGNKKRKVTIHQSGAPSASWDAQRMSDYQKELVLNPEDKSWHWSVDDMIAIQNFEHTVSCLHASDGSGDGNMHSIAIEGCINAGSDYHKTINNMAKLAAYICVTENLNPRIDITTHEHWSTKAKRYKQCPYEILTGKNGVTWNKFVEMCVSEYNKLVADIKKDDLMELKYNGVTLPKNMVEYLVKAAKDLNVPPSYLITKLHFEGVWGQSNVARENNNWSGMTWTGNPNRPSGIVVSQGGARPAKETGHYMRYKSVDDFLTDWTYLIRRGGIYKVADSSTFANAVKGMFRYGGASADYAWMDIAESDTASKRRYELYLKGMTDRRSGINNQNNGSLDKLDKGVDSMSVTAEQVLNIARKYMGISKYSASHKAMIDRYNRVTPRPVGYAVTYNDDWCDAFVTAVSDEAGATSLIGRECGVERHKSIFKQKNIWLGRVRPQAGDIIIFHWGGQINGFAQHIGFVEKVNGNVITTIEGNTVKGGVSVVGRNTFDWNDNRIQGYARPKYGSTQTPKLEAKNEKKVAQHFVVTIDSLRAFNAATAKGKIVETITKDLVKNIDITVESEGYLWGGWISSVDNKRRWTTLKTLDSKKSFVDIKDSTIPHGGKTYTEFLKLQEKKASEQPVGGATPKVGKGQVEIDGTIYNVTLEQAV